VLAVMCLALALVVSAVASLNLALPEIAAELGATQTDLQWVVDAYALVFAALLLPAGALGDRVGRKGVLLAGLAIFAAAYLAAVWATAPGTLVAARAAAGVGAAAIMPVTLSAITHAFPPEERDRAVSVWAGVAGAGAILGLLISGTLLELASWEWVFAVNAAWAVLALVAVAAVAPTAKDPADAPLDPGGALLSALGLGGLVFAIIEAPSRGWDDATVLGSLAGALVALAAFVAWELRRERPMLDPRLFRERGFSAGTLALTLQFFCLFGFFFVLLQYLQLVLGWSPLESALALVPMALMLIATSRGVAPRLAPRYGPGRVIASGLALMAVGFGLLTLLTVDATAWQLLPGLLVLGTGAGLSTAPATATIVAALPPAKQGVASAVNDAAREVGGALGIAVLGSVATSLYAAGVADASRGLPARVQAAAEDSLAYVLTAAPGLGERGPALLQAARESFLDGLAGALLLAAGVLLVGAVAVLARSPGRARARLSAASRAAAPPRGG